MSKKTNKKRADKERKPAKITKYLYTVEEVSQEYRYWTIESNKPLVKDDGSKKDLLEAMDVTVNPQNTSAEREKLSNGAEVEVSFRPS